MAAQIVDMPGTGDEHLSHIVVQRRALSDPGHLAWAIHAARAWLGPEVEAASEGMRRYQADLRLRVSDNPSLVTFRKAALVDIGAVRPKRHGWEVEISWRASTMAPLFPVFSGTIVAEHQQLTISGWYSPPGGAIGRVADRVLLHIAAEGTSRWLLREIDEAAAQGAL
jgi:hypothetical protein